MSTLPRLSRSEQLIAATADLTRDFALSYDAVADLIPRDAPEDIMAMPWDVPGAGAFDFGAEPELDSLFVPPARNPEDELPLADWIEAQAAWYDQCSQDGSELIASAIRRIGMAAEMHNCRTAAQVMARSPLFQRANLSNITTPDARPRSILAGIVDAEVEGYLLHRGALAHLVAWTLLQLADEADYLGADTEVQFVAARAEFEARAAQAADDDDEGEHGDHWYKPGHSGPMPF